MNKVFDITKKIPNKFLGQWRSIEFELIFKSNTSINDFAIWAEASKLDKNITIKADGSISFDHYNYEQGKEVVVSYRKGDEDTVRLICSNLKDKAFVNKSCGTHVHFDMRGFDLEVVKSYGARLAQCVPALRLMLPKSRQNNHYCSGAINGLEEGTRYSFINMQAYIKHKTIEVRAHSGTINASKILNWISICEQIMLKEKSLTSIDTIPKLIAHCDFNEEMTNYINGRIEKLKERSEKKKSKKKVLITPTIQPLQAPIEHNEQYNWDGELIDDDSESGV